MATAAKYARQNKAQRALYAEMRYKTDPAVRRCLGPGKEHSFRSKGVWNRICPACVQGDHYSSSPQFAEAMPVHEHLIRRVRPGNTGAELTEARNRFLKRTPKKVSK